MKPKEDLRFQSGYLVRMFLTLAALGQVCFLPTKWPEALEARTDPLSPDTTMAFTVVLLEA